MHTGSAYFVWLISLQVKGDNGIIISYIGNTVEMMFVDLPGVCIMENILILTLEHGQKKAQTQPKEQISNLIAVMIAVSLTWIVMCHFLSILIVAIL